VIIKSFAKGGDPLCVQQLASVKASARFFRQPYAANSVASVLR
jgi:hypothetical protein